MTNEDLYRLFRSTYPEIKPVNYRPAESMFVECCVGLTIWTDNGDMLMYFPNPVTLNKLDTFTRSEQLTKLFDSNMILSKETIEKLLNNEKGE